MEYKIMKFEKRKAPLPADKLKTFWYSPEEFQLYFSNCLSMADIKNFHAMDSYVSGRLSALVSDNLHRYGKGKASRKYTSYALIDLIDRLEKGVF